MRNDQLNGIEATCDSGEKKKMTTRSYGKQKRTREREGQLRFQWKIERRKERDEVLIMKDILQSEANTLFQSEHQTRKCVYW